MKMRHPGCHHMMAWQLTATMVRGGNAGCLPSLYHQRDQLARQMVPEVLCDGRLARWPARGFALGTTSIATQGITSGPRHRSTNQLGHVICGNVFLLAPGQSVLARQTVTTKRQLVFLVAMTVGRHRCWGAHSISFGFDTHHPDPLLQAMGSTA